MDQDELDSALQRALLDLGKTVGGGGIDPGHQLEVEHQKAAFGMPLQKRLDVLIKAVGRAEEQIALEVEAEDAAAVGGEHRLGLSRTVERASILGAVKTVLDGIDARGAERKGGAADDDAKQNPGNHPPLHDHGNDHEQRHIFDDREAPPRLNDPFVKRVGAEIEQQSPEYEFGYVAEQGRRKQQHQERDCRGRDAREWPGAAAVEIEHGAANGNASGITA